FGPAAQPQPTSTPPSGAPYGASQHGMSRPPYATGAPAPSEQPTLSLDPTFVADPAGSPAQGGAHSTEQRQSGRPVKVAGLTLAAALVGGVAGFGGSAIGTAVFDRPASQSATGPQSVTVNNPGSVNETTAIASEVLPSVVTIEVAGSSESGSGSGVILDEEGHVLTNTHVVTLGGAVADPAIRVTTSDGRIF